MTPEDLVAVAVGTAGFPDDAMTGFDVRFVAHNTATDATAIDYRGASLGDVRRVMIWDDAKTPMDHVTQMLMACFDKSAVEAVLIMLETHDDGGAPVGTYPRAEAVERVSAADSFSKSRGQPLEITLEDATFQMPARSWWAKKWTAFRRP
jgi:ATP-dependent Clp protease adapter protein ClpS